MIEFEIIKSPDQNVVTSFKYFQNIIYLGSKTGDLVIQDSLIQDSHIFIEVVEEKLLIHLQKGIEYYLLNGKRATTIRKLKVGDKLEIGMTVLKIVSFETSVRESKADILNKKLSSLIAEGSARLPLIERLTKMMK